MPGSGTPTDPTTRAQLSRSHANALARRRRLLADEHYGPLYARATKAQAAAVDTLVEAGDTAGAKNLLDAQAAARREASRARYLDRRRRQVVQHIITPLHGIASYQLSTVEEGVEIMTPAELTATLRWNTRAIRDAAASGSRIRPDLSALPRNPWWYH